MFDLERAIAAWRREMRAAGLQTLVLLAELENHLRDATAAEIAAGASAPEAFAAARQRLGTAEALHAEFGKDRRPDAATVRKWVGLFYAALLGMYALLQMRVVWRFEPTGGELGWSVAGIVATLLTAYAGWSLVPGVMKRIPHPGVRSWVAVAGTLSGFGAMMIFGWFALPHLELMPGQFAAVFVWAMLPMLTTPTLLLGADWEGAGQDGKTAPELGE